MKVLFALSSFYPDHRAGTETYVLNLSKELINLGYCVSIIIPDVGKISDTYNYEGIWVYTFSVPKKVSTKELNGLEKPSGIEEFKQLLQQIKPDIFHLHSLSRSVHAQHLKLVAELGIKTVFSAHLGGNFCARGDLLLYGKQPCNGFVKKERCLACFINMQKNIIKPVSISLSYIINSSIFKPLLIKKFPAFRIIDYKLEQLGLLKNFSNKFVAIASWLKQIYTINGLTNAAVIEQGIDNSFLKLNSVLERNDKRVQLIFVGRMHPLKNIELVLEALKENKQHFNFILVTIPFDDEIAYYKKIKSYYSKLNYTDWFENLPQNEVAVKIEQSDILVLPSKFEAAPLVILEAFAKKIPVIGSDYIAIKEMVKHNINGLLFKNGDAQNLKDQLKRLINEPDLLQKLTDNIKPVRTFKEVATAHDKVYKGL